MQKFNYKKAIQALNFFAKKSGGTLNKMKALKLIWLSDRLHLRQYGRPIIQDYYVAMENGPVASATRDILQKNALGVQLDALRYSEQFLAPAGQYDFKSINEPVLKVFSKTDLDSLQSIFDAYGHLGKFELRDLTHQFPEWKNKWENAAVRQTSKSVPMDYDDFFLETERKQPLFDEDKEMISLAKNLFLRKE